MAPQTEYVEEPPVGFSLGYYDARGLRVIPVVLAIHSREPLTVIQQKLLTAYLQLCEGLAPRAPRTVREAVQAASRRDDDGPSAA
jgi:hypothetical protein